MHLLHNCQKSQILNKHPEKDGHDWLEWSYMQGNQTKNDARPPLAVLNYILDKACLSYQGEHCSPTDLCQRAETTEVKRDINVRVLAMVLL